MTDITYQTGTSDVAATHTRYLGTRYLAAITTWCCRFAEGARDGQKIAARYHELSRLSGSGLAARGLTRQTIARAALTGH
jgi:hypothetical protein